MRNSDWIRGSLVLKECRSRPKAKENQCSKTSTAANLDSKDFLYYYGASESAIPLFCKQKPQKKVLTLSALWSINGNSAREFRASARTSRLIGKFDQIFLILPFLCGAQGLLIPLNSPFR